MCSQFESVRAGMNAARCYEGDQGSLRLSDDTLYSVFVQLILLTRVDMIVMMGRKHKRKKHTKSFDSVKPEPVVEVEPKPRAQTSSLQESTIPKLRAMDSLLYKINKITTWQASFIIAILGFITHFTGLTSPFQGDDIGQIVSNIPVHSISHIKIFFEGGTFYNGGGLDPLIGVYFRPLMTTVYSLLYTLFGPHPFAFHLLQLMICIGSAVLLYLIFSYSLKPLLALFLSLIFLVHPLNSQVVYYIPNMQDALFFFFGILALYLLIRFKSLNSLWFVALCLFLSMLSKESAALFIAMSLIYLYWFDEKKRLFSFIAIMVAPIVLYMALRINAIGLFPHPSSAPIDNLSLAGRLLTVPSIPLFYISKFIFPWSLASTYDWIHPSFSFRYFLLPLLIDIAAVGIFVYLAFVIHKRASKAMFYTYLFYALWAALGLLLLLQILPLDMTVAEWWFYFPMVGVLGMLGVALMVLPIRVHPDWLIIIAALLIGVLGLRTALRGLDWQNPTTLAYMDIKASPDDYYAYDVITTYLSQHGQISEANSYAVRSNKIYPTYTSYYNIGITSSLLNDYPESVEAFNHALQYNTADPSAIYGDLSELTLVYGSPYSNAQFFKRAIRVQPNNFKVWLYLSLFEGMHNNNSAAKVAISKTTNYGPVPPVLYSDIMNDRPVSIYLPDLEVNIKI